jgi:serine/threonine protein kinase
MTGTVEYRNALALQSLLHEYRLESILGAGSFGTTYLGWDTNLEKYVAIKEYLPTEFAVRALDGSVVPITSGREHDYKWGLDRFLLEARTLAKFGHPHIVRVNRYFEGNGTAYMVMDYEKGEAFNEVLRRQPFPGEDNLKSILIPLLDGLEAVHQAGFLHRDIKPGNIFLREGGSPVLIDFGAARQAVGGATKSLTAVVTPGYAPLEQYSTESRQGPWSDIYAMSGVLFRAVTNANPPDAVSRMRGDTMVQTLAAARGHYSAPFVQGIEWGLALDEKKRPQEIREWKSALLEGYAGPAASAVVVDAPAMVLNTSQRASATPQTRLMTTRPVSEATTKKTQSNWPWLKIAAAALILLVVGAAWDRHRRTQQPVAAPMPRAQQAAEPTEPVEAKTQPAFEPPANTQEGSRARPPAVEPGSEGEAPVRDAIALPPLSRAQRERPTRDRGPRPGDSQDGQPGGAVAREFRSADRDGDGFLSRDEVRGRFPFIDREFRRVDASGDGRISQQEFWRLRQRQAETMRGRP